MKLYSNSLPDVGIVFKGHILECWLPSHAAKDLPYNPRHLPVVIEEKHEDYNLYRSILRIMRGYRTSSSFDIKFKGSLPASPFIT